MVVGCVPEIETTIVVFYAGGEWAERFHRTNAVLDQSGVCVGEKWQITEAGKSNSNSFRVDKTGFFFIHISFSFQVNLIGRLQLSTERSQLEDNQSIVQLRILRTQEAIIKILKTRKRISNQMLQTELVDILKNMFLPSKKMIKEQLEWLIEHKYMKRDDDDINTFIYLA